MYIIIQPRHVDLQHDVTTSGTTRWLNVRCLDSALQLDYSNSNNKMYARRTRSLPMREYDLESVLIKTRIHKTKRVCDRIVVK